MATPKNRSVMKAFTLLQAFNGPEEWLTSSELSRRAKMPEASGYRLVQTLEGIGAIVRGSSGRYRPGMLLLQISQNIVADELWREAPDDLLRDLGRKLDMTVQLGVFEDGMVTYVARAGKPGIGLPIKIGMQFEAYCTGLGKVLLAALPPAALDAFLAEGELVRLTERTIIDPAALRAALEQVRARGYALDDRETLDTVRCLAAPIRDPMGRIVAAVSISDTADSFGEFRQAQVRDDLLAAARAIGERLYPWSDRGGVRPTRIAAC